MVYSTFSVHAPTGADSVAKKIVSPNEYADEGRAIGYPSRFSIYVNKQSTLDGSFSVTEPHVTGDLVGNRLFLYHRPLVNVTGGMVALAINGASPGTISAINAKQGFVDFSVNPGADFNVVYTAAPDCLSLWHLNTVQDDVMEIQRILGPTNQTGWLGLRNLTYALLNTPNDSMSGVLANGVCLPHLARDVKIGSSSDTSITGWLGDHHTIQVGYYLDNVIIDATGISLKQSAAANFLKLSLSNKTGDQITFEGSLSGAGQTTIGGSSWGNRYSGNLGAITTEWYTGSILRVNGNASILGGLQVNGTISIVNTTGSSSTVMGDWTIRDELFVYGTSHLLGQTETNRLTAHQNIYIDGDIVANNVAGGGGAPSNQSLVDNLDASEVAATYTTAIQRTLPNSIIAAPKQTIETKPLRTIYGPNYILSGTKTCGEQFFLTGYMNAQISISGEHQSVFQVRFPSGAVPAVSGFGTGLLDGKQDGGFWSKGMFDPGSLWIEVLNGAAQGYKAPIYTYNIQEVTGAEGSITRVNLYTPVRPSQAVAANDIVAIYNPGSIPYKYIYTANGDPATFYVSGSTAQPLKIAFEDHVRVQTALSATYSMKTALQYSVSGLGSATRTGVAYIFASANGVDVESAPVYSARPTPFRMPGETLIGEIVATSASPFDSFTVTDVTCYRPGSYFDTQWLPIISGCTSGRAVSLGSSTPNKVYFKHDLGADTDFSKLSADLYLASYGTGLSRTIYPNEYMFPTHSLYGGDHRHQIGLSGMFTRIPLDSIGIAAAPGSSREASVFYVDGKVIGIQLNNNLTQLTVSGIEPARYMRLVLKRLY